MRRQSGSDSGLNTVIPRGEGPGWWDRGTVLTSLAVSIALGATSVSDIDLLAHQAPVFGDPPSDSTVRRCLAGLDQVTLGKIAKARAKARRRVWDLVAGRPCGFPWLLVADKLLHGWIVIDLDATLITAHSDKQGAAVTFKKGYGFHPLGAWCANTTESLAMLLREGNAGSNTVSDHTAPRGVLSYPQHSWEKLEGRFLGLMAHLDLKSEGDRSMPGNHRSCSDA